METILRGTLEKKRAGGQFQIPFAVSRREC